MAASTSDAILDEQVDQAEEIDRRVRRDMLVLFAKNAPMGTAAAIINVGVIAFVMKDLSERWIVWSWVTWQIALSLLRMAATILYTQLEPSVEQTRRWETLFSTGVVLQAVGWGVAGGVFFAVDSPLARTFIAVMLAGMVAGGVSVLSPLRGATCVWVLLLVIPEAIVCFHLGGLWFLFACCAFLFVLTQWVAVQHAHTRLITSVRMGLRNQALATSLSRINLELEKARDAAMHAAQAKADFLANMSHEIRTPMTSILGYADLIRGTEDPGEIETYSAAIQRNGKHLLVLINDILDLSKIEAGKLIPERIECSPAQIIQSAVTMLAEAARAGGLELTCRLAPVFPRSIHSDPVRLRQVLVNLLSNAVKFTPSGSVSVEADVERKDDHAVLQVRVTDSGIGMTHEQLGQLFQPFTQADAGVSRRYGGTGLGLSISQNLARLLGGSLCATSAPGQGSCFELALDLGPWDEVPMEPPAGVPAIEDARERYVPPRFHGRVLLAEDGADNQRLIRILLEQRGLVVELADDGVVALRKARLAQAEGRAPDLVLMDIQMPEMDGATATRILKAEGFSAPIVALTAQALEGDRERFMDAGFDGYESKPIEPVRLDRLLGRFLDRDSIGSGECQL